MPEPVVRSVKEQLTENLNFIERRINDACSRSSRKRDEVTLVVVSKYRPLEQMIVQYDLGERHFGESRVQEGRKKIPDFNRESEFHLIGPLQTNKAKYLPGLFQWIHSVDRSDAIEALEKAFAKKNSHANVLIQVNVSDEEQKGGCTPDETAGLVQQAQECEHLKVQGLMTMAPYDENPEAARPHFRNLAKTREDVQNETGVPLPHLSMGMSGDFEVAIEEGATIVRIGSSLYELEESDSD